MANSVASWYVSPSTANSTHRTKTVRWPGLCGLEPDHRAGQGPGDPFDGLDAGYDQLAK
jgi:hypothetical protein